MSKILYTTSPVKSGTVGNLGKSSNGGTTEIIVDGCFGVHGLLHPWRKSLDCEIHGRVVCDVCGDSSIGPEDHILEGAEVAVLCITKAGEVLNYQAFTNEQGMYTVAETMPESDRWDACLARPISSFHDHCTHLGEGSSGVKFSYNRPSGYSHSVRPFVYRPANAPSYCI